MFPRKVANVVPVFMATPHPLEQARSVVRARRAHCYTMLGSNDLSRRIVAANEAETALITM
jgi:hypothetical protein